MIRWIFRLALVVALVVGLDRLAVGVVQGQLAAQLQKSEGLASRPSVHIGGFPFLTQVVGGTYTDVRIDVHGLTRDRLEVSDLQVKAQGLRIKLGDAIRGRVREVPVEHGTVRGTVTFASVDAAFASYGKGVVSVHTSSAGHGKVRLDGQMNIPTGPYRISGVADVSLTGGRLKVTPAPALLEQLPTAVRSQATTLLTPSIALPSLPFGIQLESVTVKADGVVLVASARGIVLHTTGNPTGP
jgi:hypothetical protein